MRGVSNKHCLLTFFIFSLVYAWLGIGGDNHLGLLCVVFSSDFVTFTSGVLDQVWYLCSFLVFVFLFKLCILVSFDDDEIGCFFHNCNLAVNLL